MPRLYSGMPKDQYLKTLKRKFDSPLRLCDSRVTGLVIGSFFAAAHYQSYEWNRRITGECNRAWGIVKASHGKLEICFIRGKGLLAPGWFLVLTSLCRVILLLAEMGEYYTLGPLAWVLSAACALIACAVTALGSSVTEEGAQGIREINKFLEDPENYYC